MLRENERALPKAHLRRKAAFIARPARKEALASLDTVETTLILREQTVCTVRSRLHTVETG